MADASMTDSRAVVFPGQAGGAIVPASNAWERISVNSDRDNWDYASMSSDDSEDVPIECGAGISTLWVGNIPEEATEHDLRVYFRSVPIVKIRLSKKRPDKRPCAYVDVREEDMDRALRLSGERLLGARLKVEYDPSRLQKLRKRRQNLAEGKPESPESLNDIERMRITPGNSENEPWVPGQLRKWSSTSALDVAAALPKKTATTLQRSVGKPSLEGTLTPNPISISTSSAGTKSQWSNAANPGGRLTSSRSMNSLAGEPSTLNTALPAGWSTHANPNSSWDSPPRKPMSFTSGAEWDRPNEGGGGGKWDAALRPPSTLLGGPKTAPPSAAPVAPWSMEGAPTIVGAGRMPLKNGGNTMMNDSSQGGNVNWTMYGKTGTGLSAGLDDGSWMQQNGGGGQGGAKPGWNAGRTFAQADASPASFQASWNQRGGMVGGDHGGNWMGGGASASANRMTNSMGQSQSNVGGMIGAEVEQMPTFAPGWMRGHAMGGPPHMPVSGGPPPHAIRRKGSLPNLPLMGGKGASWEHNPNSIKDPSTLWVNHPTAPVLDPAAWSALSRKKEAAGIWKDLDGNTQNGSGGKLSPVVQPSGGSSSRLPPGPVTGMPSVNVSVTPIGHAWEAAKAVEQQINVAAMEAVDTKVWGPTGWHPEWRRT
ncbi:hypothetical protein BC829DRAFT_274986 [Chytridium lagenaria]|nr:hypothetical protein BC829DRAFT_274986 [Chytridium lagenaria]